MAIVLGEQKKKIESKSIKKIKKIVDVQTNVSIIGQELIGRVAYCWCEECNDNSVQRVKIDSIQCIQCENKINHLIGKPKVKKYINELIIL